MKTKYIDTDITLLPDPLTMAEIEFYENGKIKRIVFRDLEAIYQATNQIDSSDNPNLIRMILKTE